MLISLITLGYSPMKESPSLTFSSFRTLGGAPRREASPPQPHGQKCKSVNPSGVHTAVHGPRGVSTGEDGVMYAYKRYLGGHIYPGIYPPWYPGRHILPRIPTQGGIYYPGYHPGRLFSTLEPLSGEAILHLRTPLWEANPACYTPLGG